MRLPDFSVSTPAYGELVLDSLSHRVVLANRREHREVAEKPMILSDSMYDGSSRRMLKQL